MEREGRARRGELLTCAPRALSHSGIDRGPASVRPPLPPRPRQADAGSSPPFLSIASASWPRDDPGQPTCFLPARRRESWGREGQPCPAPPRLAPPRLAPPPPRPLSPAPARGRGSPRAAPAPPAGTAAHSPRPRAGRAQRRSRVLHGQRHTELQPLGLRAPPRNLGETEYSQNLLEEQETITHCYCGVPPAADLRGLQVIC